MANPKQILPYPHVRLDKTNQDNTYFDSIERSLFNLWQFPIPGPYADDAAAKAAGIQLKCAYHQTSGAVVVRLT